MNGTVIGVDLVNGVRLMAARDKLSMIIPGLLRVIRQHTLSPRGVAAMLGHIQWLDLMNRPSLSVLAHSYSVARLPEQLTQMTLPLNVLRELASVLALTLQWNFDLTKPWSGKRLATDASPSFGFVLSCLKPSPAVARSLGRLAEHRGAFVTLLADGSAAASKSSTQIGQPHLLHLRQHMFGTLISQRCRYPAHPGLLEAHGVRIAVDWIARCAENHGQRWVLLIDAKAVLGAVAKGGTSAGTLQRQVCRIAALMLACDVTLHLLYIPSEHNPPDAPSRGRAHARPASVHCVRKPMFHKILR